MESPTKLLLLEESDKELSLSEIVDSAKNNYAISIGNSIRLESLQEWIRRQQKLFEDIK